MEKTKLLTQKQIDYCMECGLCTGSCPVSRELSTFSPRQIIKRAVLDPDGELVRSREIWACLSCASCSARCPADIDFPEFINSQRQQARQAKNFPQESHHGILQTVAGLQTRNLKQQRTGWAKKAGVFRDTGEYFYFVGCLPFFDVTFRYLNLSPLETARSVLMLLNKMGIEPVISNNERCCGHDALWCGDLETFRKLARWNLEVIKASGAKTVLFGCPEGYVTFKNYYPKDFGALPFEVLHMTEFLVRELPNAGLKFQTSSAEAITYHDPCRLGRMAGIYEPPRQFWSCCLKPGWWKWSATVKMHFAAGPVPGWSVQAIQKRFKPTASRKPSRPARKPLSRPVPSAGSILPAPKAIRNRTLR